MGNCLKKELLNTGYKIGHIETASMIMVSILFVKDINKNMYVWLWELEKVKSVKRFHDLCWNEFNYKDLIYIYILICSNQAKFNACIQMNNATYILYNY